MASAERRTPTTGGHEHARRHRQQRSRRQGEHRGGSSLHGVFDIDADGKNEILTTSGFTNQGATTESATLHRFDNGKLVEVKSFGEVYADNCAGPFDPKEEQYTVVRAIVQPEAAPEFATEKKNRPCQ